MHPSTARTHAWHIPNGIRKHRRAHITHSKTRSHTLFSQVIWRASTRALVSLSCLNDDDDAVEETLQSHRARAYCLYMRVVLVSKAFHLCVRVFAPQKRERACAVSTQHPSRPSFRGTREWWWEGSRANAMTVVKMLARALICYRHKIYIYTSIHTVLFGKRFWGDVAMNVLFLLLFNFQSGGRRRCCRQQQQQSQSKGDGGTRLRVDSMRSLRAFPKFYTKYLNVRFCASGLQSGAGCVLLLVMLMMVGRCCVRACVRACRPLRTCSPKSGPKTFAS